MSSPEEPGPLLLFPDRVWAGLLVGVVAQALFVGSCFLWNATMSTDLGLMAVVLIGVSQALWALPLLVYLYWSGRRSLAKGIWIAVGLTVLLNGTCMALVAASF